jgi:7,8-dihydropterin-6-yl-methyl-4-(beta-D-ribofuranosyl)aminobenzene 5'-phosphate synthase
MVEQAAPDLFIAEHGFSALITLDLDGSRHRVLFDTGVSESGMVENMRRLGLDPKDIEAVVLSHGHFDHTMGLHGLARAVGGRRALPLALHPDAWLRRRLAVEGRDPLPLPALSAPAVRAAGFEVIEDRRPSFLLGGALLITGEVDRTTDFERGFPPHQALREERWEPDPLVADDQAAILNVEGRGLVVITGCGHAGVVNIIRHAQRLTGIDKVYAVIGGFHLSGASVDRLIAPTAKALAAIAPQVLVPAHCTGAVGSAALAAAMPDAYVTNSIGTQIALSPASEA